MGHFLNVAAQIFILLQHLLYQLLGSSGDIIVGVLFYLINNNLLWGTSKHPPIFTWTGWRHYRCTRAICRTKFNRIYTPTTKHQSWSNKYPSISPDEYFKKNPLNLGRHVQGRTNPGGLVLLGILHLLLDCLR